jgi:hypothetical protein
VVGWAPRQDRRHHQAPLALAVNPTLGNGNIDRVFQINEQTFLERWRTFLRERYGLS